MLNKVKDLVEVKTEDTFATAIVKGAVKGYAEGMATLTIGFGTIVIGTLALSKYIESQKEEEEIEEETEVIGEIKIKKTELTPEEFENLSNNI